MKEYRTTPNKARVFCSECGSPLYSDRDDLPEAKRLRLGTLDSWCRPRRSGSISPMSCPSFPSLRTELAAHTAPALA
ncbi:GFA family protein [Halomonas heilongjiangensis]|uniref:GFA family protein n=1 Tax=Halomonas heilongjiangensis TaxID=1387883 RepID=UPI001F0BC129|nr:GFA family protein [Halomonas heilongjiangensis]